MAVYVSETVRVRLGASGCVISLEQAKDGKWQHGTVRVNARWIVRRPDGKRRPWPGAGSWTAVVTRSPDGIGTVGGC